MSFVLSIITLLLSISIVAPDSWDLNKVPNETVNDSNGISKTASQYQSSVVTITGYKSVLENENLQIPLLGDINIPHIGSRATMGTGFVVSGNGEILTNKHVVNDDTVKYRVTTRDGKRYPVERVYKDPDNDIAVVKVKTDSELKPMELGSNSDITTGEEVASFGTVREGLENQIKTGIVSGMRSRILTGSRNRNDAKALRNVIQTNLNLVPGNSGSPLIDSDGKVIGINTAKALTYRNIGFAISIDSAKNFLNSIDSNQ